MTRTSRLLADRLLESDYGWNIPLLRMCHDILNKTTSFLFELKETPMTIGTLYINVTTNAERMRNLSDQMAKYEVQRLKEEARFMNYRRKDNDDLMFPMDI